MGDDRDDGKKLPYGKWFWRDWMSDLELRSCSPAARGIWMDMLCVAAHADPVGYVAISGKGLDDVGIAKLSSITLEEAKRLRTELETAGVFSRNRVDIIYCRRMVRDAKRKRTAVENGRKGGNPNLRKRKANPATDKPDDNRGTIPPPNDYAIQPPQAEINPQSPETRVQRPIPLTPTQPVAASEAGGVKAPTAKERTPDDIVWAKLRVDVTEAFEKVGSITQPDTNWVEIWRGKGYSPALCLTMVRSGLAQNSTLGSLKYFDKQLEREHAKIIEARRSAEGLAPKPAGPDWRGLVERFATTSPRTWMHPTPPPGALGCLVPRAILSEILPTEFPPLQS